jgi:hypothetical protein
VLAVIPGVDLGAGPVGAAAGVTGVASFLLGLGAVLYTADHGGVYLGDGTVFLSGAMGESLATLGIVAAVSPPGLGRPALRGAFGAFGVGAGQVTTDVTAEGYLGTQYVSFSLP